MSKRLANPSSGGTTIYEIARRAGVSSSTVARVLKGTNKENWASSARRAARIRRIAKELGYRPNWRARAFSEKRTRSIGMLQLYRGHYNIFDGVNSGILDSFTQTLQQEGYHLVIVRIDDGGQWEPMVIDQRLDGCAMLQCMPAEVQQVLRSSRLPNVLINDPGDAAGPQVLADDFGGAVLATEHLLELGHRRIAMYVHDEADPHYSIGERRRGFEHAMDDAGLKGSALYWHDDHEAVLRRVTRSVRHRPTAVICYSHREAIPLIHGLWAAGVRVPQDLSIIAFNDVYPMDLLSPPVTTVSFDMQEMGRVAGQMLLSRIGDGEADPPEVVHLPERLTVRGSTGPPPDAGGSE